MREGDMQSRFMVVEFVIGLLALAALCVAVFGVVRLL
jgi:hypothetical protein